MYPNYVVYLAAPGKPPAAYAVIADTVEQAVADARKKHGEDAPVVRVKHVQGPKAKPRP